MNEPHKMTIIRDYGVGGFSGFTVISGNGFESLQCCEGLCYDEMLGVVARAFCPTMSDGTPARQMGHPLFLTPPKK